MKHRLLAATCLLAATLAAGCAGISVATIELPPELAGAGAVALQVPGAGSGRFAMDGGQVSFERGATQLTLLGLVGRGRSTLEVKWQPVGDAARTMRCKARQVDLMRGSLSATVQGLQQHCESDGAATLTITERSGGGGRRQREGEYRSGGLTLQVQSVHRLKGAALAVAEPAGYVVSLEGKPLAALDVAGGQPRLWRAAMPPALQAAVAETVLVLALAWEPPGA